MLTSSPRPVGPPAAEASGSQQTPEMAKALRVKTTRGAEPATQEAGAGFRALMWSRILLAMCSAAASTRPRPYGAWL